MNNIEKKDYNIEQELKKASYSLGIPHLELTSEFIEKYGLCILPKGMICLEADFFTKNGETYRKTRYGGIFCTNLEYIKEGFKDGAGGVIILPHNEVIAEKYSYTEDLKKWIEENLESQNDEVSYLDLDFNKNLIIIPI